MKKSNLKVVKDVEFMSRKNKPGLDELLKTHTNDLFEIVDTMIWDAGEEDVDFFAFTPDYMAASTALSDFSDHLEKHLSLKRELISRKFLTRLIARRRRPPDCTWPSVSFSRCG
jgi:hypothetical protein